MFCSHCAHEVKATDKFCGNCGTKIESASNAEQTADISNDVQQKLDKIKQKWNHSRSKMTEKRRSCGMAKIAKTVELRVRILDKDQKMVQRAFLDESGVARGYIALAISPSSCCEEWALEVSSHFRGSLRLHPLVSTRKGEYNAVPMSYTYLTLRESQKERKISTKKFGLFFQIQKGRSSIIKAFIPPKICSKDSAAALEDDCTKRVSSDDEIDDEDMDCVNAAVLVDLVNEGEDDDEHHPGSSPEPVAGPSMVHINRNRNEQAKAGPSTIEDNEETMPVLMSPSNVKKCRKITTADESSDLEDPAVIEVEEESLLDEMVSFEKLMRKKQERQSIAESIEIGMPSGKDAKEIAVIYRSHGGMAFERIFRPDDSLKSIYTWLCAEIEADILPPKFSLGCSDPASCTEDGCQHAFPLTAEIANRSGIGSLPEVLFIKEEEYTGNDTLTGYDDVLFA